MHWKQCSYIKYVQQLLDPPGPDFETWHRGHTRKRKKKKCLVHIVESGNLVRLFFYHTRWCYATLQQQQQEEPRDRCTELTAYHPPSKWKWILLAPSRAALQCNASRPSFCSAHCRALRCQATGSMY